MKYLSFLLLLIYTQAYSQTCGVALEEIEKFQLDMFQL